MSRPFAARIPDAPGKPVGRTFVATAAPTSGPIPPMQQTCKHADPVSGICQCDGDHTTDEKSIMRFLGSMWVKSREAKKLDHQRLARIERLYRGQHYRDAQANDRLIVTNYCYSNVETVAGVMNKARAMPRVEPTQPMDAQRVKAIRETAHWWQTRQRAWMTRSLGNRVKTKYGYTILLLTIDPKTGMPFVSNWSPWDFYWDASARDIPGCEYFIFGAPIPTARLRQMFPDQAAKIVPDNYTSPGWEVTRKIDEVLHQTQWIRNYNVPSITNEASTPPFRSNPQPTGGSQLSPETASSGLRGSDTTFFWQFVVHDSTQQTWRTPGQVYFQSPIEDDPDALSYPDWFVHQQPACPSGWRSYFAVPNGLLAQAPIDECFGGLPFVIDYYVRHEGKIEGIGEVEQIASLNRSINEGKNMLRRSLRIACSPVLRSDKGSGINYSRRTVDAGDVLEPNKGATIEWLEYSGPGSQQFEQLAAERHDMEIVSGVHEALQGIRPEGIETGIALSELQGAAATRIQSKMPEANNAWAELTLKALKIMRAKLIAPIAFRATDGTWMNVGRDDLAGEYTFSFPADENDLDALEKIKNDALTLYQLGIIDRQEVLQRIEYPDWPNVVQRMMQMDLMKAQIEAEAKAKAAANGGKPPGNGGGPPASGGGDAQEPAAAAS
jgi:hypothetical protein